jgi:hypothetical protein
MERTTARHRDARVARVVTLFEQLRPEDVARLDAYYTPQAYFKDPFNEVDRLDGVQGVFRHMFEALREPRFVVRDIVVEDAQCFLTWDFHFRFQRWADGLQTVRGGSHLRFADDGRIDYHRDYWDAAEELYEKLPALGALMRWLRRQAGGGSSAPAPRPAAQRT